MVMPKDFYIERCKVKIMEVKAELSVVNEFEYDILLVEVLDRLRKSIDILTQILEEE